MGYMNEATAQVKRRRQKVEGDTVLGVDTRIPSASKTVTHVQVSRSLLSCKNALFLVEINVLNEAVWTYLFTFSEIMDAFSCGNY
jgi:hypothetical protein